MISIITVHKGHTDALINTLRSIEPISKEVEHIIQISGTRQPESEIEKIYPFAKFYYDVDAGPFDGMNKGVEKSSGKWLLFVNSGDECLLDLVQLSYIKGAIANDNIQLLIGNTIYKENKGDRKIKSVNPFEFQRPRFSHPATFIEKQLFKSLHGFDIKFKWSADYDFFLRMSLNHPALRTINVDVTKMDRNGISNSLRLFWARTIEHFHSELKVRNLKSAVKEFSYMSLRVLPGLLYRQFLQ